MFKFLKIAKQKCVVNCLQKLRPLYCFALKKDVCKFKKRKIRPKKIVKEFLFKIKLCKSDDVVYSLKKKSIFKIWLLKLQGLAKK